jgi:ABC-type thiamin/hydroxymethylpyrimidine transport system permease subunit
VRPVINKSLKQVSAKGFCSGIESIMVGIFRKGYLKAMLGSMTFGHDYYENFR